MKVLFVVSALAIVLVGCSRDSGSSGIRGGSSSASKLSSSSGGSGSSGGSSSSGGASGGSSSSGGASAGSSGHPGSGGAIASGGSAGGTSSSSSESRGGQVQAAHPGREAGRRHQAAAERMPRWRPMRARWILLVPIAGRQRTEASILDRPSSGSAAPRKRRGRA